MCGPGCSSGVARRNKCVGGGGGHIHIFVFTDRKLKTIDFKRN